MSKMEVEGDGDSSIRNNDVGKAKHNLSVEEE